MCIIADYTYQLPCYTPVIFAGLMFCSRAEDFLFRYWVKVVYAHSAIRQGTIAVVVYMPSRNWARKHPSGRAAQHHDIYRYRDISV